MSKQQTAVDWLVKEIDSQYPHINILWKQRMIEQAKQTEKEQMDKVSEDWWKEGLRSMNGEERKYKSFQQYYNETYGGSK
jgi:hypothetical protein